jgi:hypothetical protein
MNKNIELKLVNKYPDIFSEYNGDMKRTCMCWGFECGNGWYNIIDKLCSDIKNVIGNKDINVVATQVKEKFGGLRFYFSFESSYSSFFEKIDIFIRNFMFKKRLGRIYWKFTDFRKKFIKTAYEKIDYLVEKAQSDSLNTCEICGNPGKCRGNLWLSTTCDECKRKLDDKNHPRPWEEGWNK